MNAYTHHHVETNDLAGGANAIEARQRTPRISSMPLGARMRVAPSKAMISGGARLDARQR